MDIFYIILTLLLIGGAYFAARKLKARYFSGRKGRLVIDDTPTTVRAIEKIAELTTATFFEEKVVIEKKPNALVDNSFGIFLADLTNQGKPILEDEICLIAKGVVRAGYDFSAFRAADFRQDGGTLYLRLPQPKILDVISNPQDWEYFSGAENWVAEQTNIIEQQTKERFAQDAIESGILSTAEENGRDRIKMIFLSLGYKDVVFTE